MKPNCGMLLVHCGASVSEIYIETFNFKAMVYHVVVNRQVKLSGYRTRRFVTLLSAKGTVTIAENAWFVKCYTTL